jgi:hypothetical protein
MQIIWTKNGIYNQADYESEADLESAILEVQKDLFGANRIYLDVKKKIGAKGGQRNIPDGYLLDLSDDKPKLFVVENELAAHDPLRHIAVQILQFSLSFESEPRVVKQIIFDAVSKDLMISQQCETYAIDKGFRNLDHMLEYLVFESKFSALVIIDEAPENLENVLVEKFAFGVEVIQLARYENERKEKYYFFEPFLADVGVDIASISATKMQSEKRLEVSDIDTIVVPARPEGFERVFLGQNRWYAIRMHGSMKPQIKYIAVYQVAPVSAITHIASVKSIEPWQDSGKYVVNFSGPAREIGPIQLVKKGRVKQLQNARYTTRAKLDRAVSLDDVW